MAEEQQNNSGENTNEGGEPDKGKQAEDVFKGLNLAPEQLEALKANKDAVDIVAHALEVKRQATKEAKERRMKLEELEAKMKAEEEAKAKKKGEFEKLYTETKSQLEQERNRNNTLLIDNKLSLLAAQKGILKPEYLKLMDKSGIEVNPDTLQVTGVEEKFNAFYENNKELFGKGTPPNTDRGQPNLQKGTKTSELELLKALEAKAKRSASPRDLALYESKRKELKEKGLI